MTERMTRKSTNELVKRMNDEYDVLASENDEDE